MTNNYELNDEQLSSVAGGIIIELSEEDQAYYDGFVKPLLETFKESMSSLPQEQKDNIKEQVNFAVEGYANNFPFPNNLLKEVFANELRNIILNL